MEAVKDIISFFEENYEKYKVTLKETSFDIINEEYATDLENIVYSYDDIIKHAIFKNVGTSCSQDAILFVEDTILFIEFKNAILEQKVFSNDKSIMKKYKMKFNEDMKNKLLLKGVEGLYVFKKIMLENGLDLDNIKLKYILCFNEEKNFIKPEEEQIDKLLKSLRDLSDQSTIRFGLFRLQNDFYYDDVRTLDREAFKRYIGNVCRNT